MYKTNFFIICLLLCISFAYAGIAAASDYKIKIVKKDNEQYLFGGLGASKGSIGCVDNIFILENNSLSFKCGEASKFTDYIYVYRVSEELYACPIDKYDGDSCLKCDECRIKEKTLRDISIKY